MASNPYFTNVIQATGSGPSRVIRGARQRIVRAVPGSQGKEVQEEPIDYTNEFRMSENWMGDLGGVESSPVSGFGRWEQSYGHLEERGRFPVERFLGPLSAADEARVLESEERGQGLMSEARVGRDPVTRIPDNIAEQDPRAESDAFFGSDKYPREIENVMDRIRDVDPGREQVEYKKSKAVPIKIIRRPGR